MKIRMQKNKLFLLVVMMLMVLSLVACGKKNAGQSDEKTNVETNIDDIEVKVDEAETNIDNVEVKVDEAETNIEDIEVEVDEVETNIDDVEVKVDEVETNIDDTEKEYVAYRFKNKYRLEEHYEKHGIEMGFDSKESYEKAASDVINNSAALHKLEAEDGDNVYYIEETNEFVILSQEGFIRTYFLPSAGKAYYDRQ